MSGKKKKKVGKSPVCPGVGLSWSRVLDKFLQEAGTRGGEDEGSSPLD